MKQIARFFLIFAFLLQNLGGMQVANAAGINTIQTSPASGQTNIETRFLSRPANPDSYPVSESVTLGPAQTSITAGTSVFPARTEIALAAASADSGSSQALNLLNSSNFSIAINPPYLPKSKQIDLKFKINQTLIVNDSVNLMLKIIIIDKDQSFELEKTPVTNLVDKISLYIDQGCDNGCILHVDLLDKDQILASAEMNIQKTQSFAMSQDGGEFKSQDGKLIVRVSKGALTEDTTFYIAKSTDPDIISNSPSGHPFEIDAEGTPDGASIHHFNQDIQIIYAYDNGEFPADPSIMSLVYYDENTDLWNYLPTEVDSLHKLLIGTSNHLTTLDTDVNAVDKYKFNNLQTAQISLFTGAATYAYPFNFPVGPAGLKPSLSLNYSSNTVDGASSSTQASWVGMGWNLDAGSITRNTQGTADLADDVFSLNLGGSGGTLIPYLYSTSTDYEGWPYVEYHTQDESYIRIRHYLNRSNITGYDGDNSVWRVWDKAGNLYYFTQGIYYTNYNFAPPKLEMWNWPIKTMTNVFGQTLTFDYDQYSTARTGTGNYNSSDITSVYLKDIVYPNNTYKIFFNRSARHDYNSGCFYQWARCAMDTDKLDSIVIKHSASGTYDVTDRTYIFSYKDEDYNTNHTNGLIFPNLYQSWRHCEGSNTLFICDTQHPENYGVVLALLSVTEFGEGGTDALPPTSFSYEDNMHLTTVTNGYNGKVVFVYQNNGNQTQTIPWPPTGTTEENTIEEASDPTVKTFNMQCQGTACNADFTSSIMPGGVYWVEAMVTSNNVPGSTVYFALAGPGSYYQESSRIAIPQDNNYHNFSAKFLIPITTTTGAQNVRVTCVGSCYVTTMNYGPVVARYRVASKELFDNANTSNFTAISYSYTNPAVNDVLHSDYAQIDFTNKKVFVKPYSQFMGHQTVTETRPDGHTITTFNQTGRMAGKFLDVKVYSNDASPILLTETINTYVPPVQNPTQSSGISYLPSCPDINPCNDAKIYWTDIASTENRMYAADGTSFMGTKVEYLYDTTLQGGTQYGNQSNTLSYEWSGGAWTLKLGTRQRYYPNTTGVLYLVSLPAYTNTYSCNGSCAWDAASLLSSTIFIYTNPPSVNYSLPPASGKLTVRRAQVRWTNPVAHTNAMYADEIYAYDTWGNQNTVTRYTGEGTSTVLASTGAQTTTTCYGKDDGSDPNNPTCVDDGYHTYAGWQKDAMGHVTEWIYNDPNCAFYYSFGLPRCEKDPNGNVTWITLDEFGHMTSIVRPGDTGGTGATVQVTYHMPSDGSYYWTEASQKIDATNKITVRKFYNGLDQLIQTQIAGAIVNGIAKDIITDYLYDIYDNNSQSQKQSIPYTINPSSGYHTPPAQQDYTKTTYDVLGRTLSVTTPDGASTTNAYTIDLSSSPTLKIDQKDPLNNHTFTYMDVWGHTLQVIPPTGPGITYTYSAGGNLLTVTRSGPTTTMMYDIGNRKVIMADPDMGSWNYSYDALGNLTLQTDARGCTTNLTYDYLNRLTGKTYGGTNCSNTSSANYYYDETAYGSSVGHRTRMVDGSGITAWTYDSRGRITQETKTINGAGIFKTAWTYNSADLLATIQYPADNTGALGELVTTGYVNNSNLVNTVFSNDGIIGTFVGSSVYDEAGRLVTRTYGKVNYKEVFQYINWTAQNGGMLDFHKVINNVTNLLWLSYTYDPDGNILTMVDHTYNQTQTFTYDSLNRLINASAPASGGIPAYSELNYTYDSAGRLTKNYTLPDVAATITYGDSNHVNAATSASDGSMYAYDANGNMVTRTPGGSGTNNLSYNTENQLISVSGQACAAYVYDGDGNRVEGTVNGTMTAYIGNYFQMDIANLAVNSSFECGSSSATNWTQGSTGFPATSFYWNNSGTAIPNSGSKAYAISNQSYGIVDSGAITVSANTQYDLYAYMRGKLDANETNNGSWSIVAISYNGAVQLAQAVVASSSTLNTTSWVQNGGRFTTPANTTTVKVELRNVLSSGWVAFDDVSLIQVGYSTNLVVNPGFESGTGNSAANWTPITPGNFPATAYFRSTAGISTSHTGSYGYSISNFAYGYLISDMITVLPSTGYTLNAYLRGVLNANTSYSGWIIRAVYYDTNNTLITQYDVASGGAASISTTWQQKGGSLTTPANAAKLKVYLYNYQSEGWVAFDDVSLIKVGDTSNLVANPGFEAGTGTTPSNWTQAVTSPFLGTSGGRDTTGIAGPHLGTYGYAMSNLCSGSLASDQIIVSPNTQYNIHAFLRGYINSAMSLSNVSIEVDYLLGNGAVLSSYSFSNLQLTSNYQWFGGQITVPNNLSIMYAKVLIKSSLSSGWVAVDDVSVTQTPTYTKYYYAGGQRVGMRVGSGSIQYTFSDHLGSTVLVLNSSFSALSVMRYDPWGKLRYRSPTDPAANAFGYTGQRQQSDIGLDFYNARWYDPYLNRWTSPDSIIPDPYNPQSYDRYSYVRNNPINRVDPSGHLDDCGATTGFTEQCKRNNLWTIDQYKILIASEYGVTIAESSEMTWNVTNLGTTYKALNMADDKLNGHLKSMIGGTTFTMAAQGLCTKDDGSTFNCYHGWTSSSTEITFYSSSFSLEIPVNNFLHETGHILDYRYSFSTPLNGPKPSWVDAEGYVDSNILLHNYNDEVQAKHMNEAYYPGEYWADAFSNYVDGNINLIKTAGMDMYVYVFSALAPYINSPLPKY